MSMDNSSSCGNSRIERLLPHRKSSSTRPSTTLEKLVREENKLGSGILEREGPAGRDTSTRRTRRMDSGRRKYNKPLPLPSSSPFYVAKLPRQRSKPKVTQHFVTKTAKRDVEDRLKTITNRIALLKIEHERIGRLTRAINEKTEEVRRRQETRDNAQQQTSTSPRRSAEGQTPVGSGGRSSFVASTSASAAAMRTQEDQPGEESSGAEGYSRVTCVRDEREGTIATHDICGHTSVQGSERDDTAAAMSSVAMAHEEEEEHSNVENQYGTEGSTEVTVCGEAHDDDEVLVTTMGFGGGAWGVAADCV